jgi:hypothetical protein
MLNNKGDVKLVLSSRGQNAHPLALEMDIAFESPCPDYDRFCQDSELIANFKVFEDKPTVECSAVYCISKDSVGTPRVLNFSPKEGPRAGGTKVIVQLKDLPVFSESDVTVTRSRLMTTLRPSQSLFRLVDPASPHRSLSNTCPTSLALLEFWNSFLKIYLSRRTCNCLLQLEIYRGWSLHFPHTGTGHRCS